MKSKLFFKGIPFFEFLPGNKFWLMVCSFSFLNCVDGKDFYTIGR